jgi:hypothetical protein
MSATPAKTIERNRIRPDGRNSAWAARDLTDHQGPKGSFQVRAPAGGGHHAVPTQGQQEAQMRNSPQYQCNGAAKRCAICDGKFGLVRHYSWRTALCSKKCADRFKIRQEGDRRWLPRFQAA